MHGYWDIEHNIICFIHFRPLFALLPHEQPQKITPWTSQKIKILKKKNKKTPTDIAILYLRTINDSHMMYRSWDMDRHIIFCPFTPITPQKIKMKKWKISLEILSFYTCAP